MLKFVDRWKVDMFSQWAVKRRCHQRSKVDRPVGHLLLLRQIKRPLSVPCSDILMPDSRLILHVLTAEWKRVQNIYPLYRCLPLYAVSNIK